MHEFFAWLIGLVSFVIPGLGATPTPSWNGYVEARYVYVAPVSGGQITGLPVHEGDAVKKGEVLFTLTSDQQQAALAGAEARVNAAQAALDNLTTGSREDEIDVIEASLQKAEADRALAGDTADRTADLFAKGLVPQAKLDQDNAALKSAAAAVAQLQAQLKVAQLPARDAQQVQAEANVAAAKADVETAKANLADRTVLAPVDGQVDRLYYDAGETAGTGAPVVALLPADTLKVKFYLPQGDREQFALGDEVAVSCDGCGDGLTAKLSYFASDPQFTPPVIYSRDERQRLSFLAEATLTAGDSLHPGQPVTVERLQ